MTEWKPGDRAIYRGDAVFSKPYEVRVLRLSRAKWGSNRVLVQRLVDGLRFTAAVSRLTPVVEREGRRSATVGGRTSEDPT